MSASSVLIQFSLSHACNCLTCGVPIMMAQALERQLRESHETFYCVNGHGQHWPGKSELEKTRELLETERRWREQERERRERAERKASVARGQVTKLKNRAAAGLCPCCNRSFANLARHMATKHPDIKGGRDV